jgi:uncharacterized protein YndB with AHSA1/START domain
MTALTHEHSWSLPAPPERVFAAFTEPATLTQWFAEHAQVEPRAGGAYRFWGRYSYGSPSAGEATQRLLDFAPPNTLSYTWRFGGQDSTVTLTFAPEKTPQGDGTKLSLRHHFDRAPEVPRVKHLVDDVWRLHVGNLMTWLMAGPDGLVRVDFADPRPEVRATVLIDAPRERVFAALLDPEMLNRWIASRAEVEPRAGGRYTYGWNYAIDGCDVHGGPTRIIEIVENEKLVTDWPDWRGDPQMQPTTVTWLLESVGTQTRVTLVHGVFERVADLGDYGAGWGWFLSQLKAAVEAPAAT